jgi:hypothetical protein
MTSDRFLDGGVVVLLRMTLHGQVALLLGFIESGERPMHMCIDRSR